MAALHKECPGQAGAGRCPHVPCPGTGCPSPSLLAKAWFCRPSELVSTGLGALECGIEGKSGFPKCSGRWVCQGLRAGAEPQLCPQAPESVLTRPPGLLQVCPRSAQKGPPRPRAQERTPGQLRRQRSFQMPVGSLAVRGLHPRAAGRGGRAVGPPGASGP